jgi:putative Holliday junction resolvase
MAIDYGKTRVGIAISDPLCVISQPLLTLKTRSKKELIERLKFIIKENSVGLVLVGNPISKTGKSTDMSEEVLRFINRLRKSIDIEVKLWDERYTSKYAENAIRNIGLRKKTSKLDEIAAAIILDEYLQSQSVKLV